MHVQLDFTSGNFGELASVFGLLSRLWNKEIDAATAKQLGRQEIAAVWQELGGSLPQLNDQSLDLLAVDFCQLLVGPRNHVSPVQSIWEESRFSGEATSSMQQYIDMLKGFVPCNSIIDHLAVQLQFMAALMGIAEQAPKNLWKGLAIKFSADHLAWTADFFDRAEQQAQTPFYQGLARVSRGFLF